VKLGECLAFLHEGDVLAVTKPDRLARSTAELLSIEADLSKRGIGLVVLSMGGERLDARNPTSKLMLTILAGVATSPAAFALAMPSRCRSSMTSRAQRRGADQAAEARVGSHRDRGASRHRPQRCGIVRPAWAGRHPLDAMVFGLQPLPLSATRAQRNCDGGYALRDGSATEGYALRDGAARMCDGWGTLAIRVGHA